MTKIKGRYVAQVEINFEINEDEKGLLPFDEMHENLTVRYTPMLKAHLNEVSDVPVEVTQMYADVWRVEDESD